MNHGVVIIGDALDSRIWDIAMSRGQFIAVYTRKYERVEQWRRGDWAGYSDLWLSTFVPPSSGEPLKLLFVDVDDPLYKLAAKHDRHYENYARYEPQYDDHFFKMCRWVQVDTVVVPYVTDDQKALRLLHQIRSVSDQVLERNLGPTARQTAKERTKGPRFVDANPPPTWLGIFFGLHCTPQTRW